MKLELHCEVWVNDRKGKFQSYRKFEAKSYVQQMAEALRVMMGQIATTMINTSGAPVSQSPSATLLDVIVGEGGDARGIVIGTGSAAVAIGQTALSAEIFHGVGAGQMVYVGTLISAMETAGANTRRFRISRSFINDSGASITVNETGLYTEVVQIYMLSRELIPGGATVANNSVLTVRYTVGVTV